jgi:hypothetical protein
MFLFIMFLVCSSSIFHIVMIDHEFMYKFVKRLALFSRELGGRLRVGVVPRCCLPTNEPYLLGCVVVRGSVSFIESYIIHPPLVGQTELVLHGKSCCVLAFFSDVPYT